MQPHQERVVKERDELQDKLNKLEAFFETKIYMAIDITERTRLMKQCRIMRGYRDILNERIEAFV